MQKWIEPKKSEQEILELPIVEIYTHLTQMKMEVRASDARQTYEQKQADIKHKQKIAAGKNKKNTKSIYNKK